MGRKKKNYRAKIKAFNCGDMDAWEIAKKKKLNLSHELTKFIQFLAYGETETMNSDQKKLWIWKQQDMLEVCREKEIEKIDSIYSERQRSLAQKLRILHKLEAREKLKEHENSQRIAN